MENTIFLIQKIQTAEWKGIHWTETKVPIGYCIDEEKAQAICDEFNKRYNAYNKWLAKRDKYFDFVEENLTGKENKTEHQIQEDWLKTNQFISDEIDREGFIYEIIPLPSL